MQRVPAVVLALHLAAVPAALLAGGAAHATPLSQRPAIAVRDETLSELVTVDGGCDWRRVDAGAWGDGVPTQERPTGGEADRG